MTPSYSGPICLRNSWRIAGLSEVDVARQDQVEADLPLVKVFDDVGQQPQHTARALEGRVGAPLLIEDVDHIGMERIGQLHLLPVADIPGLWAAGRRGFAGRAGNSDERPRASARCFELLHLEETATDDGIDLLTLHRRLDALHPAKDLAQAAPATLPPAHRSPPG